MAGETLVVSALGQPFRLGMLYDCRKDQLIPGITLWDYNTLQKDTDETPQPSSAFQIIGSDSIEDKSSVLDIEASLKASFLCGLVQVGGSAKYLNDQKASKHQTRVTLQYKATTNFKQLSMNQLGMENMQYPDVFDNGLATHVVTGILYGAQAFFVFDSEKSENSNVQDIQGNMKAVINKIPTINIEGQASLKMNDKDKAVSKTFSCKFHGDFKLEATPTCFDDALKVYESLPKLLGKNGENAVPQKIWLMPLKSLDSNAAQIVREINVVLVRKVQNALEGFSLLEITCNEALEDQVVQYFPQVAKQLKYFKAKILDAKLNLQWNMAKKLPLIRGGEEDESVLDKIIEEGRKSPFNIKRLSKWMDGKEREINVLRSCIDMMKGTKIVRSQKELDREVMNPAVKQALCFAFTSLDSDDPYLTALSDHLKSTQSGRAHSDKPQIQDEELQQWHHSPEVYTKMRKKANNFFDFARASRYNNHIRFLIAAIANQKHKGASIYQYKHGSEITDDFDLPIIPIPEARSDVVQYGCQLGLDPNTAHRRLSLSEGNRRVTSRGEESSYPDHQDRFSHWPQVLCREGLTGRCYWEVEWRGQVKIAVTYRGINRKEDDADCWLGLNDKSWCLECRGNSYTARHNGEKTVIPANPSGSDIGGEEVDQPGEGEEEEVDRLRDKGLGVFFRGFLSLMDSLLQPTGRVGVYLDWPAGILSFYSLSSDRLTHIHTFHCCFTEPLYPGFGVGIGFRVASGTVSLCQL